MWGYWRKARRALGFPSSNRSHVNSPPCAASHHASACEEAPQDSVGSESLPPSLRPTKFSCKLHCHGTSLCSFSRSAGITTCAICLEVLKAGDGHALFTAECSHSFHFSCIASNVRFGNLVCPVCRASWKDVPWQAPPQPSAHRCDDRAGGLEPHRNSARDPSSLAIGNGNDPIMCEALREAEEEQRRLEPLLQMLDRSIASFQSAEVREKKLGELEPSRLDDDEELETAHPVGVGGIGISTPTTIEAVQITAVAEEREVFFRDQREKLTVLIHLKGRTLNPNQLSQRADSSAPVMDMVERRAAVDLVAVLDVSGSMAGQKLALLKQAMRLVVRSLRAADRLSVVMFSSKARRVLPLRCMTVEGRRAALLAVDTLACTGGTSISGGLNKGLAVLRQRRYRNPVATLILLSDGQDSFTMCPPIVTPPSPSCIGVEEMFPVHTFGLGADHDACALHDISAQSGGTFSFIQAEELVQDAFAQCIGGLLSVVALKLEVEVEVVDPAMASLLKVESGSYVCDTVVPGRRACIKLGDLYADEDRDLLVNISLPPLMNALDHDSLPRSTLRACMRYIDPVSGTASSTHTTSAHVYIHRPLQVSGAGTPCIDVDRHRNRLQATNAIMQARSFADAGNFLSAQHCLEEARQCLRSSAALHKGDKLSIALDTELLRIQRSMNNREVYLQGCGRAYALSAQSCHLQQRATTRGACTAEGLDDGYCTPSMNSMLACSRMLAPARVACIGHQSALPSSSRRRHIVEPCQGSRLMRMASFDSVVRL